MDNTLADRLKLVRKLHHLTQKDLADTMGIARSQIAGMETDKKGVSMANAIKLWKEYRIRIPWLYLGEGEMYEKEEAVSDLQEPVPSYGSTPPLKEQIQQLYQEIIHLKEVNKLLEAHIATQNELIQILKQRV